MTAAAARSTRCPTGRSPDSSSGNGFANCWRGSSVRPAGSDLPLNGRQGRSRTLGRVSSPSATFVVWSSAWLSGFAAADDVLDALQDWAELHEVVAANAAVSSTLDIPARGEPAGQLAALLATLRRAGAGGGRLVLPVPGDVRGLGQTMEFAAEALHAGEAVVHGGIGIVPEPVAEGV